VLEKLHIVIAFKNNYESVGIDLEPYVQWITLLNEKLKSGTLMSLETHGCEMIVAISAKLKLETLTAAIENGHDVTKMGERFNRPDDWYVNISRQVPLKEKIVVRHTLIGYY